MNVNHVSGVTELDIFDDELFVFLMNVVDECC